MSQRSSICIERILAAVEDLRAFDAVDAARLAEELRELPLNAIVEHIALRLKGYVDRAALVECLTDLLEEEFKAVQQDTLRKIGIDAK